MWDITLIFGGDLISENIWGFLCFFLKALETLLKTFFKNRPFYKLLGKFSPTRNGGSRQTHSQLNTYKIENQTHTHDLPPLAHNVSG